MSAERAVEITTLLWLVAAIASLVVAVPQGVLLVRLRHTRDRLWAFRVKSTLLFGSLGLAMLRNVAVWADRAWFDQQHLGTIDYRWPLDMAVAALIMCGCLWAATLYVRVQREVAP